MAYKFLRDRWRSRQFMDGLVITNAMFGDEPFQKHLIQPTDSSDEEPVPKPAPRAPSPEPPKPREKPVKIAARRLNRAPSPEPQMDFWDAIARLEWRNVDEGLNIDRCRENYARYRASIEPAYEDRLAPILKVVETFGEPNPRKYASHFLALGREFYENAITHAIDDVLIAFIHSENCADFDSICKK